MKAWLFQDNRQKAKLGDKCPWSVGWFDRTARSDQDGSAASLWPRSSPGRSRASLRPGRTRARAGSSGSSSEDE